MLVLAIIATYTAEPSSKTATLRTEEKVAGTHVERWPLWKLWRGGRYGSYGEVTVSGGSTVIN